MRRIVRPAFFTLFVLFFAVALLNSSYLNGTDAAANDSIRDSSAKPVDSTARRSQSAPTFNKEVVRIFQKNCQTCHHPGDIAPFSLMTYQEARPWAKAIREAVLVRKMPPWKPVPGCGDFRDARGMSQDEINTIVNWVDGGSAEGSPADLPAPLEFPDGWPLGAPDLVLTPDTDYSPPTQGDMYRCFSIPVENLRGNRQIGALTVKPGNSKIVHHVIAYADPTGASIALDDKDSGPGYTCFGGPGFSTNFTSLDSSPLLGGWAPGSRGYFAPEGTGIKLENRGRVVIQVHYHPTGEKESDRTSVGLYFAKAPVQKQLLALPLLNDRFAIPPGAKNYEVTESFTIQGILAAKIWTLTPHMHLLGKKIKVELTKPGATQADCLINVDDWDFNWQGTYVLKDPIPAASGSRLKLTTIYDNSTDNPFNPNNPPKTVRWGEETTDEMSLAFIGFTLDLFTLTPSTPSLSNLAVDGSGKLTVNGSGFLDGADIEINGHSLRDTAIESGTAATKLASGEMWKVYAPPGQEVSVNVLNPDGVRTQAVKFTRAGSAKAVAAVSAANFSGDSMAPETISAAFGTNLATGIAVANTAPLPTDLAGTKVRINGVLAPLFFVAPTQVNFLVPNGVLTGNAVIEITSGDGSLSRGTINLASVAPSIFTSNSSGTGAPAAVVTKDGVNYSAVGNPDGSPNPIDAGDYLVLFGSGMRKASPNSVRVTIGGQLAPTLFVGQQGSFAGLDQLNTQIPAGLSGLVDVVISINGKVANVVKLRVR